MAGRQLFCPKRLHAPMESDRLALRDWRGDGFAARKGTRKRLQQPKRGKAAIWAEIQGQGPLGVQMF